MSEELAKHLQKQGRFSGAIGEYRKLLKKLNSIEDKIYFKNKIKSLAEQQKNTFVYSPGEMIFPVYYDTQKAGMLLKVKIKKSGSKAGGNIEYKHIADTAEKWLSNELARITRDVYVFRWIPDDLTIEFSTLNGSIINTEDIAGKSYEAALLLCLVSCALNISIKPQITVSASLAGHNSSLAAVNHLDEKYSVCAQEFPSLKQFYHAGNPEVKNKVLYKVTDPYTLLNMIMGNQVRSFLKSNLKTLPFRHCSAKLTRKYKANDQKSHDYLKIKTPESMSNEEMAQIMTNFFPGIEKYIGGPDGTIIDGIRPAVLSAHFGTISRPNMIKNFTAARIYAKNDDETLSSSAMVFSVSDKNRPTRNLGEVIFFRLKKER